MMSDADLIERVARAMYECRHPPGTAAAWPRWAELQHMKTYKLTKYRQLAKVAVEIVRGIKQ